MKILLRILTLLFLSAQVYLATEIFELNRQNKELSADLVELSMVKYGLFNVDVWKEKISIIVSDEIDKFEITDQNRADMRVKIQKFLYEQVDLFEVNYKERNKSSLGGLMRSAVAGLTNTFSEIRTEVPNITEEIIGFLEDPENRKDLKNFVAKKLDTYTAQTFSEMDYTTHDAIVAKYGATTGTEAMHFLRQRTDEIDARLDFLLQLTGGIYLAVILLLLLAWKGDKPSMAGIIAYAGVLLSLGVLLPMIEIDARIEELAFSLLDHKIAFTDQVLYYKNKSILAVVQTLMENGKPDLIGVAILIFTFSVLFPFFKLVSTLVYIFKKGAEKWKFIQFMVFKTGKWSMADVMVVAIFMAYIGFSGIVTEQLGQLQDISSTVDILTTNKSQLKEGFFLFTGFVLLGLLISTRVNKAVSPSYS